MQKLDGYQELLTITAEECGELIQACSKALRRQDLDDENLRNEIGDVMCMIELLQEWDVVSWRGVAVITRRVLPMRRMSTYAEMSCAAAASVIFGLIDARAYLPN